MKSIIIILSCLILLSSCGFKDILVNPIQCNNSENYKSILHKGLSQQIVSEVPYNIDINDEYFSWTKQTYNDKLSFMTGVPVVAPGNYTVYYNMIENLRFGKKKKHYEIRFINRANRKEYIFFHYDYDMSYETYSALNCLILNANK